MPPPAGVVHPQPSRTHPAGPPLQALWKAYYDAGTGIRAIFLQTGSFQIGKIVAIGNFLLTFVFPDGKIADNRKMNADDLQARIEQDGLSMIPLRIEAEDYPSERTVTLYGADDNQPSVFRVVPLPDANPRTLDRVIAQEKDAPGPRPLLVAPYYEQEKLNRLMNDRMSGIDLCGNGVVFLGLSFYNRSGEPNRYPERRGIKSVYRGDSSLVPRAMMLRDEIDSVSAVLELIQSRGGQLAISTVSKVLKRLEVEGAVSRSRGRSVRVVDRRELVEGLTGNYEPPKVKATWIGKIALSEAELIERICDRFPADVVKTGMASAPNYVVFGGDKAVSLYTRRPIKEILSATGDQPKETTAFPNLKLIQTDDQRVYFDARKNLVASPIQVWLEMADGDKRSREAGEPLREKLLLGEAVGDVG